LNVSSVCGWSAEAMSMLESRARLIIPTAR
jgi:hypothetical protein